jgi:predicted Ser/Thr protein kinase
MTKNLFLYRSNGKISEITMDLQKGEVVKEFFWSDNPNKRLKQTKGRGSHTHSFYRELECLKRLKGCEHFPQLLDYNEEDLWIRMTYCGQPYPVDQSPRPYNPHLIPQAQKIIDTLVEKRIKYHYERQMKISKRDGLMHPFFSAQSLHLLNNTIYLIDFESAYPLDSPYDTYFNDQFKKGFADWTPNQFVPLFTKLVIDDGSEVSSKTYIKTGIKQTVSTNAEHINKKWLDYQHNPVGDNIQDRIKKFSILKYAGPDRTMIDIGANRGRFGVELQKHFKSVDCVEPFCPAPNPKPANMTWYPMGFKQFVEQNSQQWDLVLTFACTLQIAEIDLMEEHDIARTHAELVAPGGHLIYETQKQVNRQVNQVHVQKIVKNLETYLGAPIQSGTGRRGGRMYYVFHRSVK